MSENPNISIDQQRKNDHVNSALMQQSDMNKQNYSAFDDLRFVHHSFSNTNFKQIDLSTEWAGHRHSLPFYINGMTGGSDFTKEYNAALARVAHETGLTMASGSNSIAMKDPSVSDSFTVIRKHNPNGFVLANLGAHHNLENAKKAVDLLQANALQIHLNVPQEVVMPEGDRDFSMWQENIAQIVESVGVPVIIKEVGFGMSRETIQSLLDLGVKTVDVSGRGGTNFVAIENDRRDQIDFSALGLWGQTTPESLLESLQYQTSIEVLASGGIRHFYDIIKALALGARATGISGKFLQSVHSKGVDETVNMVEQWAQALRHIMLLVDASSIPSLTEKQIVVTGNLREWAQARNINLQNLANR